MYSCTITLYQVENKAVMFCMREDDFQILNLVDVNSCEVDQNMLY